MKIVSNADASGFSALSLEGIPLNLNERRRNLLHKDIFLFQTNSIMTKTESKETLLKAVLTLKQDIKRGESTSQITSDSRKSAQVLQEEPEISHKDILEVKDNYGRNDVDDRFGDEYIGTLNDIQVHDTIQVEDNNHYDNRLLHANDVVIDENNNINNNIYFSYCTLNFFIIAIILTMLVIFLIIALVRNRKNNNNNNGVDYKEILQNYTPNEL
ncbi:uncharacterized protein LOC116294077 [Actinia tenebrosa]|uniref:Uncharacterized protein LOC116294077 n=1 Tax=Actinia tenebrosa TaxID=6105 RepID=A0A6P8HM93_ACTTE|nr:uncharacterized protein LOC116294077 [Actinia tenebrosa]